MSMQRQGSLSAPTPTIRRLRVYAFDPGVNAQLDNLSIGLLTLTLSWEKLEVGPAGEYLEVVDFDPASGVFYAPVDLNHPFVLAEDGLKPTEGVPQFHQQMVYAVAMKTIDHFERALGRVALWAPRVVRNDHGHVTIVEYVPRLRIYPHALRDANAYYSPPKKSLLFGYFPTRASAPGQMPGGMVYTALSFDIIAHETTHALLDGLHPSFNEATNLDVHALHEGFADIVALFQRFSHPEILEHQISRTRGDLASQSMLGQLAQQFGFAVGMRGALRDALGGVNPATGKWEPRKPDPRALAQEIEPHARGSILVAAVFSAFLAIYRIRSADLYRIASNGTGVLPDGEIHPDLVRRLAQEAARAAEDVLAICIRALDYCPPVDIDFGAYLRGLVTADVEAYPEDEKNYRVAFLEAFREWGIYPDGVRSLSESEVRYPSLSEDGLVPTPGTPAQSGGAAAANAAAVTASSFPSVNEAQQVQHQVKRLFSAEATLDVDDEPLLDQLTIDWDLSTDRERVFNNMNKNATVIHSWLSSKTMRHRLPAFGLTLDPAAPRSVYRGRDNKLPTIEVHSVRIARRRGHRGQSTLDLIVEIRQRRRGFFDAKTQLQYDSGQFSKADEPKPDFRFRRGCTLIIDPVAQVIRYAIRTRASVLSNDELERVRRFLTGEDFPSDNAFYDSSNLSGGEEHFAVLHRCHARHADF